jgi:hypothetical protein
MGGSRNSTRAGRLPGLVQDLWWAIRGPAGLPLSGIGLPHGVRQIKYLLPQIFDLRMSFG